MTRRSFGCQKSVYKIFWPNLGEELHFRSTCDKLAMCCNVFLRFPLQNFLSYFLSVNAKQLVSPGCFFSGPMSLSISIVYFKSLTACPRYAFLDVPVPLLLRCLTCIGLSSNKSACQLSFLFLTGVSSPACSGLFFHVVQNCVFWYIFNSP
jgi:hypothetical protein